MDNSGRTLHGALLDAELLADVYINMTRGQDALLIEGNESSEAGVEAIVIDLSRFELPVLRANEQELQGHDVALADLDKACKGKTLWRKLEAV
ncbi:DNA polymerase III subunit epsilon [compost metagenome]